MPGQAIPQVPGTGAGTAGYTPMVGPDPSASGMGAIAGAAGGVAQNYGAGGSALGGAAYKYMNPSGSPAGPAGNGVTNNAALTPTMADANAGGDLNAASAATGLAAMSGGGFVHPMSHPNHPMWGLLHHVSGAGKDGGAIPSGPPQTSALRQPQQAEPDFSGQPMMGKGGVVTPVSKMPPTGPLPANFGSARNYQQGGPVQNYGSQTRSLPMFPGRAQGAIPAGSGRAMGQGITPASTEGQMFVGANGGPVPDNTDPQAKAMHDYFVHGGGPSAPPTLGHAGGGPIEGYEDAGPVGSMGMPPTGSAWTPMQPAQSASSLGMTRGTGFVGGMGDGMTVMKNIQDNWRQHEMRNAAQDAQTASEKSNLDMYRESHGIPGDPQRTGGIEGAVGDGVHYLTSKFFDLMHGKTIDDQAAAGPDGVPPTHTGPIPGTTSPGAGQAVQAPPAPPGGPAAGTPAAPTGGAAPAQGATPPGQPGKPGAPGQPGTPGTPAPVPTPAPDGPTPQAAPGAPPAPDASAGPPPLPKAPPPAPNSPSGVAARGNAGAIAANADPVQASASGTAEGDASATLKSNSSPAQVPGKGGTKISLDQQDWEDLEKAKWKAARAATNAGMDGNQLYQSMTQLQTAHLQGQYVKWIGNATTALANGDQDQVEKSLKAASYYLPNGQPLKLHKATDDDVAADKSGQVQKGQFIVQNPFYGMPGHDTANEPKQVAITPMTLAQMGQAAQDPTAFATAQQAQYVAGAKANAELMQTQGARDTGAGRLAWGQGQNIRAQVDYARAPTDIANTQAQTQLRLAQAGYERQRQSNQGGGVKIKPSDVAKSQQEASKVVDDEFQGPLVTAPAFVTNPQDPKGAMIPNPQGNRPMRDSTKINPLYSALTDPADRGQVKAYAGEIASANLSSGMTAQEAAEAGARLVTEDKYTASHGGQPSTHVNPQTKKSEKNVVTYMGKGNDGKDHPAFRVWADGHYIHGWQTTNVSSDESGPAIESGSDRRGEPADPSDAGAQADAQNGA